VWIKLIINLHGCVKLNSGKVIYSLWLMACFIMLKVGDPLDKAAIKGIDWIYTKDEKAMSKK
jgi:hypothetical protein